MLLRDLARIVLGPARDLGLDLVANAQTAAAAAAARSAIRLVAAVAAADLANVRLLDARLAVAIIEPNVVGAVRVLLRDLAWIVLGPARDLGLDLVADAVPIPSLPVTLVAVSAAGARARGWSEEVERSETV